jgi:hypothetical protein
VFKEHPSTILLKAALEKFIPCLGKCWPYHAHAGTENCIYHIEHVEKWGCNQSVDSTFCGPVIC